MSTPRRRSARLAGAAARSKAATPGLSSVSEYHEAPEYPNLTAQDTHDATSSPPPAPSTPASSAVKPPHDEMHPSKAHQTMGQPSSALRLGFSDIKPEDKSRLHLPTTPSKVGVPSTPFTFRVSREAADTQLSGDARRLMEELREQAAKIKADLVAQREIESTGTDAKDRKIAKPKGKSGRFSAAHVAEFKKMDSIENHASAWRAQAGRLTPLKSALKRSPSKANLDSTPTSQAKAGLKRSPSKTNLNTTPTSSAKPGLQRSPSKPSNEPATPSTPRLKPSLKRKSSKANLDDYQQSPSPKKTAPPPSSTKPQIFSNIHLHETRDQRVPSKRFKQRPEDDASTARPVSRDGTSIPRPKSSGVGSARAPPSGLARFISPTKASLSQTAAQGKPTISLVKSPSKSDLGKGLAKPVDAQSLTSPAKAATPRARVISPGRFERVKSILRGHRTASGNVQTAIPQPAVSQTPGPPKIEKALPPVPLTTPRRKVTKRVAFTPEVSRIAAEQDSPSPMKTLPKARPLRTLDEDPYPTLDGVLAKTKSDDVIYPDLSGFRPLPRPPTDSASVKPPSVPGTFTFRSDHTIEFGGAAASGFGGSAGQSSVRQVRKSVKPAAEMPGSFPDVPFPGSHPNKENNMPPVTKIIFGAPHGMSNKKRHRATWDEEEDEQKDTDRAAKKRKNQHVPEGEALLAPRLLGTTPKSSAKKVAGRSVPATPGSASPTKKRGIISMSRLNALARPKNRA